MASVGLGVVGQIAGTAIGGPLGGAVGGYLGAMVGGLIDNMLFADSQKTEGPRIDDLSVTSSTFGVPIPIVYGPLNRLAGNIIESLPKRETKHVTSSKSGKGGPSVENTNYTYDIPIIAVAFGAGEISRIKKLYANKKVIFDLSQATTPPAAATSLLGMVADRSNGTHAVFDTIRFYQGNFTQQIDPSLESKNGVGNQQAYRGTCYILITNLQLADFGNQVPSFEAELEAHSAITVGAVCKDICERAGIGPISTSGLLDLLKGYVISRPGTASAALEPLALAYRFDVAEQRGQIRCVRRGLNIKASMPIDDMGAVEGFADDRPEPVRFDRVPDIMLPKEAIVSFTDPDRDYETNSQPAKRALGNSENNLSHDLAVTMTADEGRGIADRLLWEAWAGRRTARWSASEKWRGISAGDVIAIPVAGESVPFAVKRATRGYNGVIDIEGRFEDPEIYNPITPGTSGEYTPNVLKLPGPTRLILMDAPIGRSQDDDSGFYWAVATADESGWRGAQILRSSDGGANYGPMSGVGVTTVIGDIAAALGTGPSRYWDRTNVITVVLHNDDDALESLDELAVLAGGNGAWIGAADGQDGEVIQYATATLIAPATYELSNLLRGRFGTEHAIGAHGINEVFVALDANTIGRSDYSPADWNKSRLYKPVSVLTTEADTTPQSFTNTGEGKRPLSVVHVRGERDGSDNLTITWKRRSRLLAPGLGNGLTPLGEETEAYEIDILDGVDVVRTIVATSQTAEYIAADQVTDGLTPGDPVDMVIYQMSGSRGRGRPKEAIV